MALRQKQTTVFEVFEALLQCAPGELGAGEEVIGGDASMREQAGLNQVIEKIAKLFGIKGLALTKQVSIMVKVMRTLGQNMAWLLKCIAAGKAAGIDLPQYETFTPTNFIR